MIIYDRSPNDEPEHNEYMDKILGNIKEAEINYIILKNEVDDYIRLLHNEVDKKLIEMIKRAQAFNQTHFEMKLHEVIVEILTSHKEDIELFTKEPKYAHLNLHQKIINNIKENQDWRTQVNNKNTFNFLKGTTWSLPSIALLSLNSGLFNTLVSKYRPMMSMLFTPREQKFYEEEKTREYVSDLQALIQYPKDLDILFNALENHPSLFTFNEIYSIIKNTLSNGTGPEVKILNSKAVKSWFSFIDIDGRRKLIEEMHDWADENKKTMKALGPIMVTPTYLEMYRDVMPEAAHEQETKVEKTTFEDNDVSGDTADLLDSDSDLESSNEDQGSAESDEESSKIETSKVSESADEQVNR